MTIFRRVTAVLCMVEPRRQVMALVIGMLERHLVL